MDKIILIHYIDINGVEPKDIPEVIENLANKLSSNKEEVISYFIPTFTPTRVECLNPKLVSKEEFSKARLVLDNSKKAVSDFMKEFSNKQSNL